MTGRAAKLLACFGVRRLFHEKTASLFWTTVVHYTLVTLIERSKNGHPVLTDLAYTARQ